MLFSAEAAQNVSGYTSRSHSKEKPSIWAAHEQIILRVSLCLGGVSPVVSAQRQPLTDRVVMVRGPAPRVRAKTFWSRYSF